MQKLFLTTLLVLSLTACGFHLRGYEPLPPQLKVLHIESNSPGSLLAHELTQTLENSGIVIEKNAKAAPITLQILYDRLARQATSIGAGGQTTAYFLTYTATYQLIDRQGRIIAGPHSVSTTRNYSVTANQLLGDVNTEATLLEDMRRDIIHQMITRLDSPNTLRALK